MKEEKTENKAEMTSPSSSERVCLVRLRTSESTSERFLKTGLESVTNRKRKIKPKEEIQIIS